MTSITATLVGKRRRSAAAYTFALSMAGLLLSLVNGFVLVPAYLSHFSVAVYGIWLASAGTLLALSIIDPGLGDLATQRLSASLGEGDLLKFAEYAGTCVLTGISLALLAICITLPIAYFSPEWFSCPPELLSSMRVACGLAAMAVSLTIVMHCFGAAASSLQRTFWPGIALLGSQVFSIIATLAALQCGLGVIALGVGQICIPAMMVAFYLYYIPTLCAQHRLPRLSFSRLAFRDYARTSTSLIVAKLTSTIGSRLDAPIAALTVSAQSAVTLAQTGKFLKLASMCTARLLTATYAGVGMSSNSGDSSRTSIFQEIVELACCLTTAILAAACLFTKPLIMLWIRQPVYGGTALLACLALGELLQALKLAFTSNLMALGLFRQASRAMTIESPVRIALLVVLAPTLGLFGIALSNALAIGLTSYSVFRIFVQQSAISAPRILRSVLKYVLVDAMIVCCHLMLFAAPSNWNELSVQAFVFGLLLATTTLLLMGSIRNSFARSGKALFNR